MRAAVLLSTLAYAATCVAQAVPEGIEPDENPPEGCEKTVDGNFTIGIAMLVGRKRETASEAAGSALACTLEDGVLRDPYGRIGSVVANYQFQFDGPPQAGAIYTGGFSLCNNGSLALGDSTIWYRCMSGDFGNLYDRWIGDQCSEVRIVAQMVEEPEPTTSSTSSSASFSTTSSARATSFAHSSSWSIESATVTVIVSSASRNATTSTTLTPSSSGASSSTGATPGPTGGPTAAPEAPSTGAAVPTRVPRRETLGAVIGLFGAAWLL